MTNPHYLKTATQLKEGSGLSFQIVDIVEVGDSEICVYTKKGERQDLRRFEQDLGAALGLKVTVKALGGRELMAVIGGIGRCDQELCCHRWLPAPQNPTNQALDNQKLDGIPKDYLGVCGKLLCCLLYEEENFKLDCGWGDSLRVRLRKEPAAVQKKVEEIREQVTPKKEEKYKKVVRRFVK